MAKHVYRECENSLKKFLLEDDEPHGDDPYDLGTPPDARWSDSEQLIGSEPRWREVDQLVSERDQLLDLEAANASNPRWREDE